jgi:hypothetical protein
MVEPSLIYGGRPQIYAWNERSKMGGMNGQILIKTGAQKNYKLGMDVHSAVE